MFKFKGISSREMDVVVEEISDILGKASQRTLVTEVAGYDGAKEVALGYERISRSLTMILMRPEKLDEVLEWLNGQGELEYKGRITNASFYNSIEPERYSSKIKLECRFTRDPLWYVKSNFETFSEVVKNNGNVESRPIIQLLRGDSSTCEVSIARVRFKYDFGDEDSVVIDCREKQATHKGLRRNRKLKIGFDFPILAVGNNPIISHSGNPVIQIKNKEVWL